VLLSGLLVGTAGPRPPDISFRIQMIDGGASETAAVADVNHDGRLDIVSGEHWYEAPGWTKHRFRDLEFTAQYIDDFSDLIVDVDDDGFPDVVSVSWFAKRIAWWHNPGHGQGASRMSAQTRADLWRDETIHAGFNVEFAVLADVDNDGKVREIVAQENGTGQAWYGRRRQQGRPERYPHAARLARVPGRPAIAGVDVPSGLGSRERDATAARRRRSEDDRPRLHARHRRQRRRPQRRGCRGRPRLRRLLVRAGSRRQMGPARGRRGVVAGACLDAR
jgi:hypothetical protein